MLAPQGLWYREALQVDCSRVLRAFLFMLFGRPLGGQPWVRVALQRLSLLVCFLAVVPNTNKATFQNAETLHKIDFLSSTLLSWWEGAFIKGFQITEMKKAHRHKNDFRHLKIAFWTCLRLSANRVAFFHNSFIVMHSWVKIHLKQYLLLSSFIYHRYHYFLLWLADVSLVLWHPL